MSERSRAGDSTVVTSRGITRNEREYSDDKEEDMADRNDGGNGAKPWAVLSDLGYGCIHWRRFHG